MHLTRTSILSVVEEVFKVSRAELTGTRKHKRTTDARHCAAYFMWFHMGRDDEALAKFFKKSKSWASYVRFHFPEVCETDKTLAVKANRVAEKLRGGVA